MSQSPATAAGVLALALLAGTGAAQDAPSVQRFDPSQQVGIDQRLGERLPLDVALRDQTGRAVTLGELLDGRPVVVALVYYECPMLCSLVLSGLMDAAREIDLRLGDDYDLIVLSIDPGEGPELAAAGRTRHVLNGGIGGNPSGAWFLTAGDRAAVDAVADAIGFRYVLDEPSGQYAHASGIVVATAEGVLSRYLYGVEYSPRDLRLALVEASRGAVGTLADRALLLCFSYDPATGKYGFAVLGAIRAFGALTVLAIGGLVTRSLLRERRGRSGDAVESTNAPARP